MSWFGDLWDDFWDSEDYDEVDAYQDGFRDGQLFEAEMAEDRDD